jgi:hypothetical protein
MTGRDATSKETAPSIAPQYESLYQFRILVGVRVKILLFEEIHCRHEDDTNDCGRGNEPPQREDEEETVTQRRRDVCHENNWKGVQK